MRSDFIESICFSVAICLISIGYLAVIPALDHFDILELVPAYASLFSVEPFSTIPQFTGENFRRTILPGSFTANQTMFMFFGSEIMMIHMGLLFVSSLLLFKLVDESKRRTLVIVFCFPGIIYLIIVPSFIAIKTLLFILFFVQIEKKRSYVLLALFSVVDKSLFLPSLFFLLAYLLEKAFWLSKIQFIKLCLTLSFVSVMILQIGYIDSLTFMRESSVPTKLDFYLPEIFLRVLGTFNALFFTTAHGINLYTGFAFGLLCIIVVFKNFRYFRFTAKTVVTFVVIFLAVFYFPRYANIHYFVIFILPVVHWIGSRSKVRVSKLLVFPLLLVNSLAIFELYFWGNFNSG